MMASEDFEIDLGQEEQLIKDAQKLEEQQASTMQSRGKLCQSTTRSGFNSAILVD